MTITNIKIHLLSLKQLLAAGLHPHWQLIMFYLGGVRACC